MVWIVFHGQTQAIQCRKLLAENGVIGHLGKPPREQGQDSCAWAVGIQWEAHEKAVQVLRRYGVSPCAWLDAEGGKI
ncbi:MAG: DUF3343 domain-containing protein [Butyricicoccus pullicaecorum]|nr:DUF3343 domain-containing protein [Butyricicoccus pullicaecorum]